MMDDCSALGVSSHTDFSVVLRDDNGASVKVWENLRQLLLMKARWTRS